MVGSNAHREPEAPFVDCKAGLFRHNAGKRNPNCRTDRLQSFQHAEAEALFAFAYLAPVAQRNRAADF